MAQGRFAEAEVIFADRVEARAQKQGAEHLDTLGSKSRLANALLARGHFDAAETALGTLLETERRVLGADRLEVLQVRAALALVARARGRFADAEKTFREVVDAERARLWPESDDLFQNREDLALTRLLEGDLAGADRDLADLLAAGRHAFGARHPKTLEVLTLLAMVRGASGEALAREAVEGWHVTRPQDWRASFASCVLGSTLLAQKKVAAAAPVLREGLAGLLAREASVSATERFLLDRAKGWAAELPAKSGVAAPR
jgi:tetratricopeptide (TPR) repeat protein